MKTSRSKLAIRQVLAVAALLSLTSVLHATNGMNMEGYGPVATAMGGASMAFDNGTAAVINNPATLSLMPTDDRLDLAFGVLGPKITATAPNGAVAKSKATAFYMPAFGYARKSGDFVYGFGVFGQGGMGCEYDKDSWRGLGFGLENRTEVSIGRVIVPPSYKVNEQFSIAATIDYVWAGMDRRGGWPWRYGLPEMVASRMPVVIASCAKGYLLPGLSSLGLAGFGYLGYGYAGTSMLAGI